MKHLKFVTIFIFISTNILSQDVENPCMHFSPSMELLIQLFGAEKLKDSPEIACPTCSWSYNTALSGFSYVILGNHKKAIENSAK